jgi:N-acetylmuramoyl-L-alanine amidase
MRDIDKIILHCSATPEGRDVSTQAIRSWHKARGWNDIGYHWVIEIDGSLHKGRDEQKVGAHCKGQNYSSIGICYVGGADDDLLPKDTLNEAQEDTLKQIVCDIRERYGDIELHGHNEFARKACPSFDVSERLEYLRIDGLSGEGNQDS